MATLGTELSMCAIVFHGMHCAKSAVLNHPTKALTHVAASPVQLVKWTVLLATHSIEITALAKESARR